MNEQNFNYQDNSVFVIEEGSVSKKFFANVFLWMFVALGLSVATAFVMGTIPELSSYVRDSVTRKPTILGYVATLAPLGLVLLMGAGFRRLSFGALVLVFGLFSILIGVSLSSIVAYFEMDSVAVCLVAACAIFGIMAFLGYTTNVDLTKFGPILMVGLVGLIIASVVNMFMGNETLYYIISFAGVAIFTALTAYDVQKIKQIGMGIEENGESLATNDTKKLAIIAALSLYLDFINIFLYLLRIFGSRK